MRGRITVRGVVVAIVTVLFGAVLTVIAPAAAKADTTCAAGSVCFWQNTNRGGAKCSWKQPSDETVYSNVNNDCSFGLKNPRSIRNNTRYRVYFYSSYDCLLGAIGSSKPNTGGNLVGGYTIRCLKFL